MSDYNSRLPVRTETDGDVVVKIADATTPSQQLAIDSAGRVVVKLDDGAGNVISSQANGSQRALDVGIDVAGVQIDPRQVRALIASDVVTAAQGAPNTAPNGWPVKPTDGTNSQGYTAAGEAKVSVTQPLPAGTNLIGSVDIKDSSGASVTLGQKAMSASLPVVIASDQTDIGVKLKDGADNAITSTLINSKQTLDVNLPSTGVSGSATPYAVTVVAGSDGTNSRAIATDSSGKVKVDLFDATGTPFSATNPLAVTVTSGTPGTEVHNFNTAAALAKNGTSNHDYAITASKTFKAEKFWASASGKLKIEVQVSTDGTTFVTKFVGFNSTATPNIDIFLGQFTLSDTGTGAKIRIIRTNLDNPQDVYTTISGVEV